VPVAPAITTMIEFTHRIMSGLVMILNTILCLWTYRIYSRGKLIRTSALLVLFFTVTEALLGAGLVLFQLVAQDTSATRAYAIMAHLVNTYLLLGSIATTAFWASAGVPDRIETRDPRFVLALIGAVGVLFLGASGAVTALGDTLFPATSLSEGFRQDLSPTANFLIRLRVFHPLIAVLVSSYIGFIAVYIRKKSTNYLVQKSAAGLFMLFLFQLSFGLVNVLLLAPIWMQIVHLLASDLIWIALVLLTGLTGSPIHISDGFVGHQIDGRINGVADGIQQKVEH
jgi:heme A synthase